MSRAYRHFAAFLLMGTLVWTGCSHSASTGDSSYNASESAQVQSTPLVQPRAAASKEESGPVSRHAETATAPARLLSEPGSDRFLPQPLGLDSDLGQGPGMAGDRYAHLPENDWIRVADQPLSTFSIDVDTASYAKTRMYLLDQGRLPPADAVRIEELVNYFDYEYSPPSGSEPFAVAVEAASAPWQPAHRLLRVALKGREIHRDRPPCNLVFLLDVSGSMNAANKLPLVKQGMSLLAQQLAPQDRVSIVVYAGAAGMVLSPTAGDQTSTIQSALDMLHAGGSTNGGQGIELAYRVAREQYIQGGVNRVLLCTDGDFNVGTTSAGALVRLAEENARQGVFLSVLGFGMGNHNDAMLEELSNKANGNYAFVDNVREARKVLAEQLDATLVTIAKDVKVQIEFNPARVAAYRLIGYENRHLEARDFNDDRKDAGEIGAGHCVTALYEIVPHESANPAAAPAVDPLKYQAAPAPRDQEDSHELLTLKLRYKEPEGQASRLLTVPVIDEGRSFTEATADTQFAAAVAAFGMLLRESSHKGDANYAMVREIAQASRGADRHGYRAEFLQMVDAAQRISGQGGPEVGFVLPVYRSPQYAPHYPAIPAHRSEMPAALWIAIAWVSLWGILVAMALGVALACILRSARTPQVRLTKKPV